MESMEQDGMWLADRHAYGAARDRCLAGEPAAQAYAARLRRCAEQYCREAAPAVTDKLFTVHSPSRDPHDYVSIGTYWWPNAASPDGLPYVERDGEISPEFQLYDRPCWDLAADGIVTTVKGAYFLDQSRFAQEAARRARRWFCDPETCMAPHIGHAQMIPGRCTGNSAGIIDFALYLPTVLEHLQLLARVFPTYWSDTDHARLVDWCSHLLAWLERHPFGREEEERGNNHGVYYDRLVVCLSLFLDRPERARTQLRKSSQHVTKQIKPDGRMTAELRRTCSFGYTVMNLRGFVDLAWIGSRLDQPIWSVCSDGSQGTIRAGVDFLYRHACSDTPWPFPQIEPIAWPMVWPVLDKANKLSEGAYAWPAVAHRMPEGFVPELFPLVEPIHPFGETRSPGGLTVRS